MPQNLFQIMGILSSLYSILSTKRLLPSSHNVFTDKKLSYYIKVLKMNILFIFLHLLLSKYIFYLLFFKLRFLNKYSKKWNIGMGFGAFMGKE